MSTLDQLPGLEPRPQPAEGITWAPKIQRTDGQVDLTRPSDEIDRRIRAMAPWPGGWLLDLLPSLTWTSAVALAATAWKLPVHAIEEREVAERHGPLLHAVHSDRVGSAWGGGESK